jgi:acetyltransferase-like isoleucine patch superfamily enzyme
MDSSIIIRLKKALDRTHRKLLEKSSNQKRINYFRGKGMKVGKDCLFNTMTFSTEPYLIEIGDHVAIARGTLFITHDGGIWCFRDEIKDADIFGKIKIGNNVFIGNNCTILPNTTIGDNCIVGAGSVIRGQFPDDSVIVGNPAKVVFKMNMQRLFYTQNPDLLITHGLSDAEKSKIIKKHFGIE